MSNEVEGENKAEVVPAVVPSEAAPVVASEAPPPVTSEPPPLTPSGVEAPEGGAEEPAAPSPSEPETDSTDLPDPEVTAPPPPEPAKPERTSRRTPAAPKRKAGKILAVGGGKGGVGKSLLSANLGIALAARGASVVLVDCDLGGANLHTCLGIGQPRVTLSDFVDRKVTRLEDVLTPTPYERLFVVAGAFDALDSANVKHGQKTKLIRHLQTLNFDYVLLDLGAGTSYNVLDFFLLADTGIVVLLPEPTSIENAYRFIKAAFFRRLQALAPNSDLPTQVAQALAPREGQPPRTPWDVVTELRSSNPEGAHRLESALNGFQPWVVVNQARSRGDYDIGPTVVSAWKKFFGLELGFLGVVGHDDAVIQAVRSRQALLASHPGSNAANGVLRVVENLVALDK